MEQVTQQRLQEAAERAVAGGHAVGALLFGSRSRETAGPLSDWDVCLVTHDEVRNALARDEALEAEDPFWEHPGIETTWIPRARFDAGVAAGSLEANIAREGKALAGDATMATKARTVPFEAETVLRNMGRAAEHLGMSIDAARRHAREKSESERAEAAISMLTTSIAGAEALGRALCALTETEHTGDHRIARNGRRIGERADEADPPLDGDLMRLISERVQELDDTAQAVRKVEYGEPGEEPEKTIDRFVKALEADMWTRQGLLEGEGPWAGLKQHPRRGELAHALGEKTAGRAVTNGHEWTMRPVKLTDARLDRSMDQWVRSYHALRHRHVARVREEQKAPHRE